MADFEYGAFSFRFTVVSFISMTTSTSREVRLEEYSFKKAKNAR